MEKKQVIKELKTFREAFAEEFEAIPVCIDEAIRLLEEEEQIMKKFEIGKQYGALDTAVPPITILRRTEKTIWVKDENAEWSMRVKKTKKGECATDNSVPYAWRECYTYYTEYEK